MTERKPISLGTLFKETFRILGADKLIFAPYLIFSFVSQIVDTQLPLAKPGHLTLPLIAIKLVLMGWLIDMFFKAWVITMAMGIHDNHEPDFAETVQIVMRNLGRLLLCTAPLMLPLYALVVTYYTGGSASLSRILINGTLVIITIPATIILQFVPVAVLHKPMPFIQTLIHTAKFVKNNLRPVLLFTMISITTSMLALLSILMVMKIPLVGKGVFPALFQGISYTFIYTMGVVLYLKIMSHTNTAHQIDVHA